MTYLVPTLGISAAVSLPLKLIACSSQVCLHFTISGTYNNTQDPTARG